MSDAHLQHAPGEPLAGDSGASGGGASGGWGGDPSNTPPLTSHRVGEQGQREKRTAGGEDWLEWTWGVRWGPRWDDVRRMIEVARNVAGAKSSSDDAGDIVNIGGYPAVVGPGGSRLGRGSKGPYMAFRFVWQGLTFLLADRQEPHRTRPSLLVRASGRSCLEASAYTCWERAQWLVQVLGGTVEWERLSRVDLCLDMPEQAIAPFALAHRERHYVARTKGRGEWEQPGRTLYLGASPPQLRIYDKLAQVNGCGDGGVRSLMVWHRWGGFGPRHATRIEFELTREALKKRGIATVSDYFATRGDLALYLCTDWVRFTSHKPDRTHTTRAATLPLWEDVLRGFLDWTGQPAGRPLRPLPREAYDVEQLFASGLGLFMTAAVRQGRRITAPEQLVHYVTERVREQLRQMDWQTRMRRKAAEYAAGPVEDLE